jgi:hypothetical protein
MSRKLATRSLAALAGASMLALSLNPASAFTLPAPSLEQPVASAQVEKVWWHHGWGYHGGWGWRHGWGWHRPWGWGYGPGWGPHCWRGYWGRLHCW